MVPVCQVRECSSNATTLLYPPFLTRDYIKYRLGSVASSLPAADQRKICDMIVAIASADQGATDEIDLFIYARRVSEQIRGSVPQVNMTQLNPKP